MPTFYRCITLQTMCLKTTQAKNATTIMICLVQKTTLLKILLLRIVCNLS